MTPKEIMLSIKDKHTQSQDLNTIDFLKDVFKEYDNIKLLKLRAGFVSETQRIIEELDDVIDDSSIEVCNDFCGVFASASLINPLRTFNSVVNKAYITTVLNVITLHEQKEKYTKTLSTEEFEEIVVQIQESLEDEDEDIQEIVKTQIIEEVKQALLEHKIVGDKAYKKLNESLIAKFFIYKNKLKNIKSEKLKDSIKKLWDASAKYHDIYKKIVEMSGDAVKLIGFLS
ncbi:hypothetical protein CPIN18021_1081 [Campylobacter pinnipediorum subsp. caledonicus]|uniref:Uncharacterized protein n=1 Tax=Campylobacter pinnipediorum subsp. caledonicus TaxID=1874362 RepID=A0A1S6U869_9BACT|nr:hypothetical protein [Campylobacter pinnipediorum]AQW85465.1 hypothetical protein CPIN18020_0218 [Campylobacter pinnipediorum subsp. caledonicus]AQW87880.1 hypothetical protein CPIN18021_1081 [Campylobacter pinnipediorum subsp. caledonicus]